MKRKEKAKSIIEEFKKFVMRGNVIDMAVGVIIGGAFSTIVTSLVNQIFMPLINWIVFACTGGTGISLITVLNGEKYLLEDGSVNAKCIFIDWGNFIQAVINFAIIAVILFTILKLFTTLRRSIYHKKIEEEKAAAEKKAEEERIAKEKEEELERKIEEQKEELRLSQLKQTELLQEIKVLLEKK